MFLNVVYIDVLIVLNIYVTYFLIKATARFTHTPVSSLRIVIASTVGSLFSLVMLIPKINFIYIFLIKLSAAVIIVLIAFKKSRISEYIRLTFYFYIINFVFAGIIMGLKYFVFPQYISVNNTYAYIDVSLTCMVVFTALAYFIICGVRLWLDKGSEADGDYHVIIKQKNKTISLTALADTGNSMTDVFSGRPVIICPESILSDLICKSEISSDIYEAMVSSSEIKGVRLVPYSTINGTGMLPAFIPDEVIIKKDSICKTVDAMVGINKTRTQAIFNPKLLQ